MTEQEQIEEMAKLIDGSECPSEKCPKMDKEQVKAFGACNIHRAQILYNAGYQKAEEVRKETQVSGYLVSIYYRKSSMDIFFIKTTIDRGNIIDLDVAYLGTKEFEN